MLRCDEREEEGGVEVLEKRRLADFVRRKEGA